MAVKIPLPHLPIQMNITSVSFSVERTEPSNDVIQSYSRRVPILFPVGCLFSSPPMDFVKDATHQPTAKSPHTRLIEGKNGEKTLN